MVGGQRDRGRVRPRDGTLPEGDRRRPGPKVSGQTVEIPLVGKLADVFEVGIQSRAHLWYFWALVTIERESEARSERRSLVAEWPTSPGRLAREFCASLVAITAAASAIEAIHAEIAPLLGRSAEAGAKKRAKTFASATPLGATWGSDLTWLNELRKGGIHVKGKQRRLVAHPALPTNVDPVHTSFSAEAATGATDLLFGILTQLIEGQSDDRLARWATDFREALAELRRLRSQKNDETA